MLRLVLAVSGAPCVASLPAVAFTTPFTFRCSGTACRAVAFADERNRCTVLPDHSRYPVHIAQGTSRLDYVLQPGEIGLLGARRCYGYYDGGETANFVR